MLPGDAVSTWLIRGVAWTVLFELLLLGFGPLERALWQTRRGERLARRLATTGSRVHSGSGRRRFGRLAGIATLPLAVAGVLLAAGLGVQEPEHGQTAQRVVRVTEIKRPVTVTRVVTERVIGAALQQGAGEPAPAIERSATPPAQKPRRSPNAKVQAPQAESRTGPPKPIAIPKQAPVPGPECLDTECTRDQPPAVGSSV